MIFTTIQKIDKLVKTQVKLPHVNKPLARNEFLFKRHFLTLYLKIRAKKLHAAKSVAFSFHFLRAQNHNFNLTSKIIKMCADLRSAKKTAP